MTKHPGKPPELPSSIQESINKRIRNSRFAKLNPLPKDLPGLIEWLFSYSSNRISPSVEELAHWKSFKRMEARYWRILLDRLASASKQELLDVRRELLRRKDDVPLAQIFRNPPMEAVALKREIQLRWQEQFWDKLLAIVDETIATRFAVKKKRKTTVLKKREKIIRKAIREKSKGDDYFRYLVGEGLETPESWRKDGCPKSYVMASKHPHWRQAIHAERYRVKARMNRKPTSPLSRSK